MLLGNVYSYVTRHRWRVGPDRMASSCLNVTTAVQCNVIGRLCERRQHRDQPYIRHLAVMVFSAMSHASCKDLLAAFVQLNQSRRLLHRPLSVLVVNVVP